MTDRLAQLRRQRALAQEQLEWLDREIAETEASLGIKPAAATLKPEKPVPTMARAAMATAASRASSETALKADGEDLIARYRVGADTVQKDVRKGCFLYFAIALILLAAGVTILYFSLGTR